MGAPPETGLSVAGSDWFGEARVQAIFAAMNRDGHEARIVGGAVRNTLMGLPVGDIDFAATAQPEEIVHFARAAGLKPVPTGIAHGTITVVVQGTPFEVTTLRRDVETHGRHATVAFTRDWAADAARRDFTINALYAAADGRVVDPLGGAADLQARRVRFINSPRERIREDFLRILRFFRFTADYADGAPDAEGLAACIAERGGLARLSPERVRAELFRILLTRRPMAALQPMAESGLLTAILGGVARLAHFARLARLEAELGESPAAIRRLAALAVMVEEDAARLAVRLRLSNAETARLDQMAGQAPVLEASLEEPAAREVLYRIGPAAFRDRVLIAWARSRAEPADEAWRHLHALPDRWTAPVFPLKGHDLLARGIAAGPRLGATLRELEAKWIGSGFKLTRDELLQQAQ